MLKLFCNCCHEYIKQVEPMKAGKITGLEICEKCSGRMKNAIDGIEKTAHRATLAIEAKKQKTVAELEMALSKVLKGGE